MFKNLKLELNYTDIWCVTSLNDNKEQGVFRTMGMSASQGRFLMLTAQKSNNEYQAQSITFQRMMLAENVDNWTEEYNDAMQNKTLLFGQVSKDGKSINYNSRLHYDDIVRDEKEGGMSMSLVSATSNKIVVPVLPDPIPDGKSREDYFVCPDVTDADFLEKNLREGNFMFVMRDMKNITRLDSDNWERLTFDSNQLTQYISDVEDKTDDAEAQSLYDKRIKEFHHADKLMECELKRLETEHNALETEIESVQKVIKNNVESSFKTFG